MPEVQIVVKTVDKGSEGVKKLDSNLKDVVGTVGKLSAGVVAAGAVMKKAFDLSREGANLNQLKSSFDLLNASVLHTPDLLNKMKDAVNGTISETDLMQGVLKLTAGASDSAAQAFAQAAPQLLEIAKASNKLNPTLGDTAFLYESITTGIKRGSPLILDNLGIVIKVEEANQKYAESLGKTVAALTSEEKQMAILNATLTSGDQLINQVGGNVDSQSDAWARLEVRTEEATNAFKQFLAVRLEGPIGGAANAMDAMEEATDAGHSTLRNFLVVANEIGKELPLTGNGFDDLITHIEGQEQAVVDNIVAQQLYREALAAGTAAQAAASKGIVFTSEQLSAHMSLMSMYGRQHIVTAAQVARAEAEKQKALDAYGVSLTQGKGLEMQYGQAAMQTAEASNAVAAAFFRTAQAAAAEQAALLGTFNALSGNKEALADYAIIMEGVQTHSVQVSGATAEQKDEMERLQGIYDKAAGTIRDYEQGLKGVGQSEEQIAENIAEQQTLMANAQAALEPLVGIQSEYATVTDGGAAATELLNQKLFDQIQASSDSAREIAIAGIALGVYTEAEANAMLKSALLEEFIKSQAEAFGGSAADILIAQGNIQGYIDMLNGIPDVVNTDVSTNYTSTGTPPPWAGGPSSGDTGEGEGSWGGETMAAGGLVTGGVAGRDSVPALLMPGEYVMPVNDPRNPANGGGGGATTVNINIYGAMGANPQAIAGAVSRVLTPRG